ncbi:Wzz/FepE/Etk N-terminal domain-containing protein [Streptococcus uberis]|uniref:Wzz/FepE/Etk N-terminal domain-containing protein n=1 Tax=Streptococcus uberis TaxID=1349 RepID=UPI0005426BEA|nr:Wzz/FepE/Etk N-terminal domain-containing protein [Streptococcus uberis]KHD40932.1 capsular biosynthesis protein CpsC [Streptococcus hongkongensis]AUC25095.1 capsular biosynthesis protein CpsC [Streptococcus uberis]KKF42069.1 capsular polysaccharide biosynthesis protein CpsC [Streptococcus uberis Ab71]KKF48176.1 capsular polysaccharide biosynthesis protein CpsC [Streptococcus uberis C5072]KKF49218.1 capsular polysaccharide biosynthesis protein CpsC [Streptococcus uberis C8329]
MNTTETPSMEIDVLSLLKKLWMKKFLILFMALFFGTLALLGSIFLIKPSYSASTRIYVINQQNAENITATDLQAGSFLVNDYKEIITSRDVMKDVIATNSLSLSPDTLSKMISVTIPADTRVISITVTNHDPQQAKDLANSIREVASEKIKSVTKVQDVTPLEKAQLPSKPSSPNIKRNTMIGMLIGGLFTIVIIVIKEVLDDRVKRPEDVEEVLGMTLLGIVPNIDKM